jgi:hypothetical protein
MALIAGLAQRYCLHFGNTFPFTASDETRKQIKITYYDKEE